MTRINLQQFKNLDDATPAAFNDRFNAIADVLNQKITSDNLATNAVGTTNIANGAVTSAKIETQQAWQAVSYENGWVVHGNPEYGTVNYYKDTMGIVHLKGLASNGNVNAPIFTLPAGYRPNQRLLFHVQTNGAQGRVDILTNGQVQGVGINNAWVSFNGITFKADQ